MKNIEIFVYIGVPLATACWLLMLFAASGYQYESDKYKNFLIVTFLVFMFQFIVGDPIKSVAMALWHTFCLTDNKWRIFRYGFPTVKKDPDIISFFQMRIDWCKARLSYNWKHRDEALNVFYRNVAKDLYIFGRCFIFLVILVCILNEPLKFYHSDGLRKIFSVTTSEWAVADIRNIEELFDYIESNIVDKLAPKENQSAADWNWVPDEMSKLVGVVRLEQVRLKHRMLGLGVMSFENEKFLPGWKKFINYPYSDRYPRTYGPWKPTDTKDTMYYDNDGFLSKYPNDRSYITQLSRSTVNSKHILNFLRKEKWLDRHTAVLFIDFVVYNVDANIFGLCRITAESTPFGSVVAYMHFESAVFLLNWTRTQNWYWIVLMVYVLLLISFVKVLVVKIWYESFTSLLSFWNLLDWWIVIGNLLVFIFIYLREDAIVGLIQGFDMITKDQYVNFRAAKVYTRCAEVLLAIVVFAATLRLWKALMFARVCRLFIRTLQLGAADIFWALTNIMIFLIGLMLSSYMVNGPSRTQSHAPISLVHILSFSLGYNDRVNPMEVSRTKNKELGLIIYALMMFGVTLVLLNMLITLICIHFAQAKEEERSRPKPKITFWEFLTVEYYQFFAFFYKWRQKIKRKLEGNSNYEEFRSKWLNVQNKIGLRPDKKKELNPEEKTERHANQIRRLRVINDILMTQMDLLNHRLKDLDIVLDLKNPMNEK